jgi:hypothetical protein
MGEKFAYKDESDWAVSQNAQPVIEDLGPALPLLLSSEKKTKPGVGRPPRAIHPNFMYTVPFLKSQEG